MFGSLVPEQCAATAEFVLFAVQEKGVVLGVDDSSVVKAGLVEEFGSPNEQRFVSPGESIVSAEADSLLPVIQEKGVVLGVDVNFVVKSGLAVELGNSSEQRFEPPAEGTVSPKASMGRAILGHDAFASERAHSGAVEDCGLGVTAANQGAKEDSFFPIKAVSVGLGDVYMHNPEVLPVAEVSAGFSGVVECLDGGVFSQAKRLMRLLIMHGLRTAK